MVYGSCLRLEDMSICLYCHEELPEGLSLKAKFCNDSHKVMFHRKGAKNSEVVERALSGKPPPKRVVKPMLHINLPPDTSTKDILEKFAGLMRGDQNDDPVGGKNPPPIQSTEDYVKNPAYDKACELESFYHPKVVTVPLMNKPIKKKIVGRPTESSNSSPPINKALEAAMASINKDLGEGSVMRLDKDFRAKVDVISTGNLLIDHALGVGGFPRGRIVEVFGSESAGKSTLCLSVVAQAQKLGLRCAFIDVEHAVDLDYARSLGVKVEDLLFSQPDGGEEALTICQKLISTNSLGVIVVDSVAALVTRAEREGEIGDATVGAQARLMSASLRKLSPLISNANTCCIFTNQIREKVGVIWGSNEQTSGGRALKFYASVRVDIRRSTQLKTPDGNVYGNRTKVTIVKNKVAPPHKKAEFDLIYGEGISGMGSLVDLAIDLEVLTKRGSWISYGGEQVAQGRDGCKDVLRRDAGLRSKIESEVKQKMNEKPTTIQLTESDDDIP